MGCEPFIDCAEGLIGHTRHQQELFNASVKKNFLQNQDVGKPKRLIDSTVAPKITGRQTAKYLCQILEWGDDLKL